MAKQPQKVAFSGYLLRRSRGEAGFQQAWIHVSAGSPRETGSLCPGATPHWLHLENQCLVEKTSPVIHPFPLARPELGVMVLTGDLQAGHGLESLHWNHVEEDGIPRWRLDFIRPPFCLHICPPREIGGTLKAGVYIFLGISKCSLSTYSAPGSVLGSENTEVIQTAQSLSS